MFYYSNDITAVIANLKVTVYWLIIYGITSLLISIYVQQVRVYSRALTSTQVLGLERETAIEIDTGIPDPGTSGNVVMASDCGGLAVHLPFENSTTDVRCNHVDVLEVVAGTIDYIEDPDRGTVAHFDGSTALEVGSLV